MAQIHTNNIVNIELNKNGRMFRSFINEAIGEGDVKANVFGFRLYRDGQLLDISDCTVNGYFVRADGSTVVLTGAVNESQIAYVRLAQSCYAVEGNFSLAIRLIGGDEAGTMRIVDGTVVNVTTGTVVDPGSVVPSLADLMAVIGRAEAAADFLGGTDVSTSVISGTRYKLTIALPEEEE